MNPKENSMTIDRTIRGMLAALALALALPLTGCQNEGPAERAGKGIDNAAQDLKDAVDPPGPAEKAGRAVDKTLNP
jgi:hypothetical protein